MIHAIVSTPLGEREFYLDSEASPRTICPYIAEAMGMVEGDTLELAYNGVVLVDFLRLADQGIVAGNYFLTLIATGHVV